MNVKDDNDYVKVTNKELKKMLYHYNISLNKEGVKLKTKRD